MLTLSRGREGEIVSTQAAAKVKASHLRRNAYLYIRQSTLYQVANNAEWARRQYDLRGRAVALGWPAQRMAIRSQSPISDSWAVRVHARKGPLEWEVRRHDSPYCSISVGIPSLVKDRRVIVAGAHWNLGQRPFGDGLADPLLESLKLARGSKSVDLTPASLEPVVSQTYRLQQSTLT
jgi:hypothetical protein